MTTTAVEATRSAEHDAALHRLHQDYARDRDPASLRALCDEYERYALSLARRLNRGREPQEDLEQIAREGLIRALARFEPERGIPFVAFATPTILGALRRHYRDRGWSIRVPRWVHETATSTRKVREHLRADLGREPTTAEVADALHMDPADLLAADAAAEARNPASLDRAMEDDGRNGHDVVGTEDRELVGVENRVALRQAMAELPHRDHEVLALYFFEERTQSDIARRFGVSQMQVSRWLSSALGRLRSHLGPYQAAA
jgi:RNA polymerase sigma-B factor